MDPNRSSWNLEDEKSPQVPRPSSDAHRNEQAGTISQRGERASSRVGYGLPCAQCKTYYAADAPVCPHCGCPERIAPSAAPTPATELKQELEQLRTEIAQALGGPLSDGTPAYTPEEKEKFLREYKSKLYATHTQINPAAAFRCTLDRNHHHGYEPAAICKSCYNQTAERTEQLEAALCMDVREAAQLIYEAVWSDPTPSDPSRTYQNAAQAVLTELRRRAGMSMLFGAVPPYTH
ncbi:MAG TPA: hypothetical protein VKT29_02495 [Terriglobales bacterium]|nr:hypothetical protein [Terriglobales bacterium]